MLSSRCASFAGTEYYKYTNTSLSSSIVLASSLTISWGKCWLITNLSMTKNLCNIVDRAELAKIESWRHMQEGLHISVSNTAACPCPCIEASRNSNPLFLDPAPLDMCKGTTYLEVQFPFSGRGFSYQIHPYHGISHR